MISFFEASIKKLSIHHVGNKLQDEFYVLSESPIPFNDTQSVQLLEYFLNPFTKVNEVYNLYHPNGGLENNQVYRAISNRLKNNVVGGFHQLSIDLAVLLYDCTNHPKIKRGEVYFAMFENIQYQGDLVNAFGIFKSEQKETFLKVDPKENGFNIQFQNEGISLQKLDKGCLIFNVESENGYRVLCIDQNSSKDASNWKDEFLTLKVINDDYQKTSGLLGIAKDFIINKLDEEFEISKSDKADLLNKSIQYFKENESFDIDEFTTDVFQNKEATSSFKKYKSIYDEEFDTVTPDNFSISTAAVKKRQGQFKAIIKLDKNFHIYVHGSKDLIEKGFDAEKNMNYYKVYFRDED